MHAMSSSKSGEVVSTCFNNPKKSKESSRTVHAKTRGKVLGDSASWVVAKQKQRAPQNLIWQVDASSNDSNIKATELLSLKFWHVWFVVTTATGTVRHTGPLLIGGCFRRNEQAGSTILLVDASKSSKKTNKRGQGSLTKNKVCFFPGIYNYIYIYLLHVIIYVR